MQELARVTIERRPEALVATVTGEIDLSNAELVEQTIVEGADAGLPLVVDLSSVEYIDSAGMAMLQRLRGALAAEGRRVAVRAARRSPAGEVIVLTGLAEVLMLSGELDEAIAAVLPPRAP